MKFFFLRFRRTADIFLPVACFIKSINKPKYEVPLPMRCGIMQRKSREQPDGRVSVVQTAMGRLYFYRGLS